MKELVGVIARALVDHPDEVRVTASPGAPVSVIELRVNPQDLGKIIGRQGRTAKSIRREYFAAIFCVISGCASDAAHAFWIARNWPLSLLSFTLA